MPTLQLDNLMHKLLLPMQTVDVPFNGWNDSTSSLQPSVHVTIVVEVGNPTQTMPIHNTCPLPWHLTWRSSYQYRLMLDQAVRQPQKEKNFLFFILIL